MIAFGFTDFANVRLTLDGSDLVISKSRARLAVPVFTDVAHHEFPEVVLLTKTARIILTLIRCSTLLTNSKLVTVPLSLFSIAHWPELFFANAALNAVSAIPYSLITRCSFLAALASIMGCLIAHTTYKQTLPTSPALFANLAVRAKPGESLHQAALQNRIVAFIVHHFLTPCTFQNFLTCTCLHFLGALQTFFECSNNWLNLFRLSNYNTNWFILVVGHTRAKRNRNWIRSDHTLNKSCDFFVLVADGRIN